MNTTTTEVRSAGSILDQPMARRPLLRLGALSTLAPHLRWIAPTAGIGAASVANDVAAQDAEAVVAQAITILNLDSSMYAGNVVQSASLHMLEPLLRRQSDLQLHPFLAEEFTYVDDLTLHLRLREGVLFHNGDPLTVEDVVFTMQRVIGPDSESDHNTFMSSVASAEALDDRTVEIKTSQPDSRLLGRLALIGIVPKRVVEEVGPEAFDGSPVGTGPYRFVDWQRGDRVTFEAFPEYWQGPAGIARVVFQSIVEDATRVAELQTDQADIAINIPTQLVPEIENSDNAVIKTVDSLRTIFCFLNTHQPPFDDLRMRQAVNFAVDKQLIVDGVLDGYGRVVSQLAGPEVLGHAPDLEGSFAYDPERAKSLIAEAGFADGVEVNLFYPPGRYLKGDEVVQNLVDQLGEVGIQVNVTPLEFQVYLDRYMNNLSPELHIGMWSNANDTLEVDYNLEINVHSKYRGVYWGGPDVDQAIDDAIQTIDRDARLEKYQAISRRMVEEAVWLFLYNQVDIYGVSSQLQGWEPRPDEVMYLYGATLDG